MLTKYQIQNLLVQKENSGEYDNYGCFAQVRERNCGTKVEKISGEDYAYASYLDYIEENNSPWAPKIYAKHIDDGAFFVVMERLEAFTELAERIVWESMPTHFYQFQNDDFEDVYFSNIKKYSETNKELCKDFFKTHITPGFIEWYYDMVNEAMDLGYSTDIHASNTMWRMNQDNSKTLVITDPWYDPNSEPRKMILHDSDAVEDYGFYDSMNEPWSYDEEIRSVATAEALCSGNPGLSEMQMFAKELQGDIDPKVNAALELFANNC